MSDVALDGTLRAVIATDRLASSDANDGPELLRRRLSTLLGRYLVRVTGESAVVAERSTTLLKELSGWAWRSIGLPRADAPINDVAYGAGALWLATTGGL